MNTLDKTKPLLRFLVDSDACPVKSEILRVAKRYGLSCVFVAAAWQQTPKDGRVSLQVVGPGVDAADDWIVGQVTANDIVVTADIPLAARCVAQGAAAISPAGKVFDPKNVGSILATRDLLSNLRNMGEITGGPAPFSARDSSRFLQELDRLVQAARRRVRKAGNRHL